MKKVYLAPTMMVVRLQPQRLLMQSTLDAITGNADLILGGAGGTIIPRAPELSDQDNIWEDEEW